MMRLLHRDDWPGPERIVEMVRSGQILAVFRK